MWGALLGAVVGGFLALAGSLVVEIRKDRRRQLGAARIIASQLQRSATELLALAVDEPEGGWHDGPHAAIRTNAWETHAADFVGLLDEAAFELVDRTHRDLAWASELGFTQNEGRALVARIDETLALLESLMRPTWTDRYVLCL